MRNNKFKYNNYTVLKCDLNKLGSIIKTQKSIFSAKKKKICVKKVKNSRYH